MKTVVFMLIILGLAVPGWAQIRPLTVSQVKAELEFRMNRNASYATVWNTGYDFFRNHLTNQDTAMIIHEGYMAVRGLNAEQEKAVRQAAIYWQKVHDYGISNVPVAVDNSLRDNVYWGGTNYETTLGMRRPVGGPVPLRSKIVHGRAPVNGRRDNPYPGKYYPGVYPP